MEGEVILDPRANEAVHAARDAAHAVEVARQTQILAAAEEAATKAATLAAEQVASKILDEKRLTEIVKKQLEDVLTAGTEKEKSIILARVPYICQDIKDINSRGERIEDALVNLTQMLATYPIVQKLVFGGAGLILTAVVLALIALVVHK